MMMMVVVGDKALPMLYNQFRAHIDPSAQYQTPSYPSMAPGGQLAAVVLPSIEQWNVVPDNEQHMVICSGQYTLLIRFHLSLKASSYRRHQQDKTVLSCRCRRCELSSRQSQTVFTM